MSLLTEVLAVPPERREQIREAVAALEKTGSRVSVRAVKKIAKGDSNALALVLRAYREGLLDSSKSWGVELDQAQNGQPPSDQGADVEQLIARVRTAAGPGDLVEVSRLALELSAAGTISEARARVIRDLAQEQRRAMADARLVEPPPEDPSRYLLASEEAMQAARALDWMVCDDRRARVLTYIAEELELDRIEHPSADEGGV